MAVFGKLAQGIVAVGVKCLSALMHGNAGKYSAARAEKFKGSPLEGKTVIFLGSSVTVGAASLGDSFVEYLAAQNEINVVKQAVSGTTLVDESEESYISRMKTIDTTISADAFICQLSTNDATQNKPLGEVSESFELEDFDTKTVVGAIEYVICYAKQTWNCPVIFYTGTRYDSEAYGEMVAALQKIQEKWDIGVIDLWNDAEMNSIDAELYELYMADGIHPTRAGYKLWWTPKIEQYLYDYLSAK